MKKLIIAVLMFIPVAVMAKVDVYKCDSSRVAGFSQPESADFVVAATLDSVSGVAIVADAGGRFQAIIEDTALMSPKLKRVSDKVSVALVEDMMFLHRDDEYLIANGGEAIIFSNCKPAGGKK